MSHRTVGGIPLPAGLGRSTLSVRSGESDRTINRLIAASDDNGYSGWIMLNLYPERSPKPSRLTAYDPSLSDMNCAAIEEVLQRHGVTEVLGASGNIPHPTLKRARTDVRMLLDRLGVAVFTWGPLTAMGNPRHPSPPGAPPYAGAKALSTLTPHARFTAIVGSAGSSGWSGS